MEELENIKIPYPTEGVIRSDQLDDSVCPENSVQLALNMNFDRIGVMTVRSGVSTYAPTLAGSVKAFGYLNSQSSSTKYFFAQVGSTVQSLSSATGTWTSVRTGLTGTAKARFSQFLNRTWMVNGNAGSVPNTSNGGAFGTTDVPATFPKADFIEAGFDGRVWVADAAKDILYFTDIVQSTDGTTYVTPLTFDIAVNFIAKFSPQDGESITGLFRVPKALLVFKQNHIYRVYGIDNVDPYPAYNVGTYSQESIVQAKDGIYFHHSSGFYKFTYNSQPTEISRRISDVVKAIPRENYENIVGVYDGYDSVKWSCGTLTFGGVEYENCQLRYTISTQVWTIYDFAGNDITALIKYDNGTTISQVVGTSSGLVGKLDSGTTDFGASIYYEIIDRWRSYLAMYSHSKKMSGVAVLSENGAGALVQYQKEKDLTNEWSDIGTLKETYASLFPNTNIDDFNKSRFRIRGNSSGSSVVINGIELLKIGDEGLNQN